MAYRKTVKNVVKKTELESPHQEIRKIAEKAVDSEDCFEANRDCESVHR